MSLLYTGGPYRQNNGTPITSTSTDVNLGAMKSASTINGQLHPINPNVGNNLSPKLVPGGSFGQADWGSFNTATSTISSATGSQTTGLISINVTGVNLNIGSVVNIKNLTTSPSTAGMYDGPHRVVAVVGNTVTLNVRYIQTIPTTGFKYALPIGVAGSYDKRNFIFRKGVVQVHGINEPKIASPASDYGRSKVHSVKAIRTQRVATAIRAGDFVVTSGVFTTPPVNANDFAGMGADDVLTNNSTNYGTKGEYVFRYGGPSGQIGDYNGKTA